MRFFHFFQINSVSNPKYLNYVAIAYNLMIKEKTDLRGVFYYAIEKMLTEPIFQNRNLLLEYDRYYIDMYNANTKEFQNTNEWTENTIFMK